MLLDTDVMVDGLSDTESREGERRIVRKILQFGFGLLYNQLAFTYDLVSWTVSIGQWREWQRQVIPRIVGRRVLEVAHGTGNLQIDLAAAGYDPVAFDLSPAMGRIARRKLKRRKLSPPFVRGNAQHLPFADRSFDTIVSTFPNEFIVNPAAVREFSRVLPPGGRVVFVPGANIISGHIPDRLARWLFEVTGQSIDERTQTQWAAKLKEVYTAAGFEIRIERVALPRSIVWVNIADSILE